MKYRIIDYHITWDMNNDFGSIAVTLESMPNLVTLNITSPHEFEALITLLQGRKALYYDTQYNLITTVA